MNRIKQRLRGSLALVVLGIAACGGSTSSGPPPGEVTLDPTTAPAAAMVKVDGLELDACPLRTSEIRVAGQTAPTVLNARHEALMRLPLFYDEGTKWAAPPTGPQDVEIFCNGKLWVTLREGITVTELPPAPGTTEAIVANYTQVASDYKALVEQLFPDPGPEQQLFRAIFAAVEELLNGTNANTLSGLLDDLGQNHPDALALLDAVHAIGGAHESTAAFKDLIHEMSTRAASSAEPKISVDPIPYTDVKLAERMQAYVVLKGLSEDVLRQTREQFGTLHELAGDLGLELPAADRVNITLFVLDYIMNTLVVSVFPANLDSINLTILQTELQNSEVTASQFVLQASNVPAKLSINDLKAMAETLFGAPDVDDVIDPVLGWVDSFEELLPAVAEFAFDALQSEFAAYASLFPEGIDRDLGRFEIVPPLTFTAIGETRELYLLLPDHTDVITPLPDQLEWGASATHWGSAELYVKPRPAPFESFWGSLYAGGAFGESQKRSDGIEVTVGDLTLLLEQYTIAVPEDDIASVGVKLSHAPPEDEGPIEVNAERVSGDSDISVTSAQPFIFDDSNWNTYQYIVLSAAEDEDDEDGEATISVSTTVDSIAEQPTTIDATLNATEEDNDRARFVVDPYSVRVPEGETAEVNVKLSKEPPSRVTAIVTYAGGDPDIIVRSPTTMRFDEDNWDAFQTVTLYARPDEDLEEGTTQLKVSANPPAEVDETYITATEDEPGERLYFKWVLTNDIVADYIITYIAEGTVPIILDPTNQSTPLGSGSVFATLENPREDPPVQTGSATLTVRNHWTDTVCYCGSANTANCHTGVDPDHVLAVTVQFPFGSSGGQEVVIIVGEGSPYSVAYNCGGTTTGSIQAALH